MVILICSFNINSNSISIYLSLNWEIFEPHWNGFRQLKNQINSFRCLLNKQQSQVYINRYKIPLNALLLADIWCNKVEKREQQSFYSECQSVIWWWAKDYLQTQTQFNTFSSRFTPSVLFYVFHYTNTTYYAKQNQANILPVIILAKWSNTMCQNNSLLKIYEYLVNCGGVLWLLRTAPCKQILTCIAGGVSNSITTVLCYV